MGELQSPPWRFKKKLNRHGGDIVTPIIYLDSLKISFLSF